MTRTGGGRTPGSPNLYGQTGILRTTSAAPGKGGYFDIGVHGRGFYLSEFVAEMATFGVTLFDLVELGLAAQLASNSNSVAEPPTAISTGDFTPSLKLGYAFGPVAVGADFRALLPAGQGGVGLDLDNFALTSAGLLTLDPTGRTACRSACTSKAATRPVALRAPSRARPGALRINR